MAVALAIIGFALAASCIWLTVRIINRRERWAKRTLAAVVVGVPVLYVLSFGPACWIAARKVTPSGVRSDDYGREMIFYWPLSHAVISDAPRIFAPLKWWVELGIRRGYVLVLPMDSVPAGAVEIYF